MDFLTRLCPSGTQFGPTRGHPVGRPQAFLRLAASMILVASMLANPSPAPAQNLLSSEPTGTQYPSQQYYLGLEAYRAGDLDSASDLFDAALRSARRDIHGRWVDSIPSLAMLAECHWHLGSLPTAREHLDHVFQIAMRSRGWFGRVDWRTMTNPGFRTTQPNLWPETNAVSILPLQKKVKYMAGDPLTEQRIARGGTIQEQTLRTMDVVEIMRTLAVAAYRRAIILGELSSKDPLPTGLLESTKYPANLQSPIARSMIGCVRATGHFAAGDEKRSISNADNSSTFNGSVHPLTAITMLTQGSAIVGTGKADQVVAGLIPTIHIAGALRQPEWVGEAMQLAAGCASKEDAVSLVAIAQSVGTALQRQSRLGAFHCWVAGADAAVTAGDLAMATEMLRGAQTLSTRRDVVLPRLEAYAAYVSARIAAGSGLTIGVSSPTAVDEALGRVNEFVLQHRYRNQPLVSMPRIYQLNLVRQAMGNAQGGRAEDALLAHYCQDSPIAVWRRDPVDALAGAVVDRSVLHAARVNLIASQGYGDKMLVAADSLLADRFLSQLPLGGRIDQIRLFSWLDDKRLAPEIVAIRDRAGPLMQQLRASISAVAEPDAKRLAELESIACQIGLARNELPRITPPPLNATRPIAKLPNRTGLLTFVQIGTKMHATLAIDGKVSLWSIPGSGRINSEVGQLLRSLGVGNTRGTRLTEEEAWRSAAGTLRRHLIPKDQSLSVDQLDHLIVVPDGPLWYVPFELLPLTAEDDSELMGDRISIRYAPTPGFAIHSYPSSNRGSAIGIASGPLFAPKDLEQNKIVLQSIIDVVQEPVDLSVSSNEPSGLFGQSIGHFVVAAPRTGNPKNLITSLQLSPHDNDSPHGTLAGWLQYPVVVPRSVVMVGFRSPIDWGTMGTGTEMFMTMCTLRSAGVENILLSRWAVGGESTAVLMRELLQELPFDGMTRAWKRAKILLRRTELDPVAEPLLTKLDRQQQDLTGNHPLFWSGYMISTSAPPAGAAPREQGASRPNSRRGAVTTSVRISTGNKLVARQGVPTTTVNDQPNAVPSGSATE